MNKDESRELEVIEVRGIIENNYDTYLDENVHIELAYSLDSRFTLECVLNTNLSINDLVDQFSNEINHEINQLGDNLDYLQQKLDYLQQKLNGYADSYVKLPDLI